MPKSLIYTFRTFPHIEELKEMFPNVVVFGKLKEDLDKFFELINTTKPDIILGVAKSNDAHSYFEPLTINKFNKTSKIDKNGKEELKLFIPNLTKTNFKISKKPTTSFCNYSMYKIKNHIEQKELKTKIAFIHIVKKDINTIKTCFDN